MKSFIVVLILMIIFNYIGQRLISDPKNINLKKFIVITLIQSIVISLLLIYVF